MNAWLIANKSSAHLAPKFLPQFQIAGESNNIDFSFICIEDLSIQIDALNAITISHKNTIVSKPDLIISYVTHDEFQAINILRSLEQAGIPVVNSANAVLYSNNKWLSALQLQKYGVATPKTILINRHSDIRFIASQINYPIVMKSIYGYGGYGVMRLMSEQDLVDHFHFASLGNPEFTVLLQEYIGAKAGQDLRVVVLNDEILFTVLRKGYPGSFKANYSQGGTVEKFVTTSEIADLAIRAAKSHELVFGGIDLLFDYDGSFKVSEVNSAPGGLGINASTGKLYKTDFLEIILKDIKNKCSNDKKSGHQDLIL